MGELAEDIIEGRCCEWCGMYFFILDDKEEITGIHEHGYPVLCWTCWEECTPEERKDHQRATMSTI